MVFSPFPQVDAPNGTRKHNGSVRRGPGAQGGCGKVCSRQQVLEDISGSVIAQIAGRLFVRP